MRLEKKMTFKVFIASCGSLFQELEIIHPQESCACYAKNFNFAADNQVLKKSADWFLSRSCGSL